MTATKNSRAVGSSLLMINHKEVGRMYIGTSILFLFVALLTASFAAYEVADLANLEIFSNVGQFRQFWSLSREVLVLGALLPALVGLAIFLVPLQLGVSKLGFEKGVASSYWIWLLGFLMAVAAYVMDGGPGGAAQEFVELWALSLAMMAVGLIWALSSVAATILVARAQGLSMARASAATWFHLAFALAGVMVLAAYCAELAVSFVRVRSGFLDLNNSASLLSNFAPFTRFPSLMILGIPVMGIATEVISVHSDRPIKDTRALSLPALLVTLLSVVGGVSYFTTIMVPKVSVFNTLATLGLLVSVLGVLGYNKLQLFKGKFSMNPAVVASVGSLGLVLTALAVTTVDLVAYGFADTIELKTLTMATLDPDLASGGTLAAEGLVALGPAFSLMVGASLLSAIGAFHHWAIKIWGRHLPTPPMMAAALLALVGSMIWTVAQIWAVQDIDVVQLSVGAYSNTGEPWALLPLIGVGVTAASALLVVISVASLASSKVSGSSQPKWEGSTLEWATANPPKRDNFSEPVVVRSAAPLLDEDFGKPSVEIEELETTDVPAIGSGAN